MGRVVIACYKPKSGKEKELQELVLTHHQRLSDENLVTDRRPVILKAADNTIIEVFEWKNKEAIETAHNNPAVQKMWEEFALISDYENATNVSEFQNLFSEFEPLN